MYLSNGMIKLWVSSKKCRRIKADWTWFGRRVWVPLAISFSSALSLCKWDLYDVYMPGLHSDILLAPEWFDFVARIFRPVLPWRQVDFKECKNPIFNNDNKLTAWNFSTDADDVRPVLQRFGEKRVGDT